MKTIKKWFRQIKVRFKDENGIGLVESLAAVAILGFAGTAFVLSLSTGAIAVREGDQETTAQSLARAQLEYVCSSEAAARSLAENYVGLPHV